MVAIISGDVVSYENRIGVNFFPARVPQRDRSRIEPHQSNPIFIR